MLLSQLSAPCHGASGILLLYDITNEKSFDNIKTWIHNIEQHASEDVGPLLNLACSRGFADAFRCCCCAYHWFIRLALVDDAQVEKMILGNKCDMEDKRVISIEQGQKVSSRGIIRLSAVAGWHWSGSLFSPVGIQANLTIGWALSLVRSLHKSTACPSWRRAQKRTLTSKRPSLVLPAQLRRRWTPRCVKGACVRWAAISKTPVPCSPRHAKHPLLAVAGCFDASRK